MLSKKIEELDLLLFQLFLGIVPFLFGGYFEFSAYFAQIVLLIILLIKLMKQKELKIYKNITSISIVLISLGYLITSFYAIDKGMAVLGFLKFTMPLTFMILFMQYPKDDVNKMLNVIPISGIIMIIISLLFRYIPFLPDLFYLPNGRMGGCFQYSNTFALYLLIGIICIINSKKSNVQIIISTIILLMGIFLTGSRTIFILTIVCFIYFIIKYKNLRKYLIIILLAGICITIVYAFITNNLNTFARYLTISSKSSTLWGRLLYYKDALSQIWQAPFGLGFMGYSYVQSQIQTGVYSVAYVHNDLLQIALDIGIIPMVVFLISIIKSLCKSKTFAVQKQILLIIFLHIVFDFDLQFISIFLIMILVLDVTSGEEITMKINKYANIGIISCVALIYLYFGTCTFMHYMDHSDVAIKMYPIYTPANIQKMSILAEDDLEQANEIADDILKTNAYVHEAYDVKALYDLDKQDFEQMVEHKKKSLELAKYNVSGYNDYVLMLSGAIDYYAKIEDMESCMTYIEYVVEIPDIIQEINESTSDIAYRLADHHDVTLKENIENYIQQMKGVLEDE